MKAYLFSWHKELVGSVEVASLSEARREGARFNHDPFRVTACEFVADAPSIPEATRVLPVYPAR